MDLLQTLMVAFGGSAAMLVLVGFLGKTLIAHLLAREAEDQRSRIKAEGDAQLALLKAQLEKLAREDDRQYARDQAMQRYRGPLLHAAYDLQSRLYNVLAKGFFARYFVQGTPAQQHYAQHNTAFLIAQFFGWTEIIRQEVQFIEFAAVDDTRRLSDLRDAIYGLWQSDAIADPLMVWAGEQRAIGEAMVETRNTQLCCKGYAAFLQDFGAGQNPLMDRLLQAVGASAAAPGASDQRLREVQHKLVDMLALLDPAYHRFPAERRTKV